ncbi:Wzz/FepE/Etk N-terminal domain-containing protein [Cryomorphaceae bacterium 1068]|nr:Wzz/FepE/Etk N-terminal domain-containing protein [Cryomorphaceae bacterium 1068]
MESKSFDFKWLIGVVKANLRLFILVAVLSAIVGVVISLPVFMTPKYKSTAVVYPTNIVVYADESETEQLLQFFEASSVRDSVIEKFDLYTVYDIERDAENSRFYLLEEYRNNVRVSKTKYESVMLEVIAEDPQLAKDMADEVIRQVNIKYDNVINDRSNLIAESFQKQLTYQKTVLDSLESLISRISTENDVLDYGNQTRELVRGYVDALSRNGTAGVNKDLAQLITSTQEKGSLVRMLQNLSYMGTMQYDFLSKKYLEQKVLAEGDLTYTDLIVEPEVADKKFWPVRWLVLVITMISALLFTLVMVLLLKKS